MISDANHFLMIDYEPPTMVAPKHPSHFEESSTSLIQTPWEAQPLFVWTAKLSIYTLEPFHSIPMVFKANSRTFQTMLVVVMLVVLCFFILLLVMVMVVVVLVLRSARGSLLFVVLCSLCVLGCSMFAV